MYIREVPTQHILPLRQRILRPEKTREAARFENDNVKSTFHLALYLENKIIGVASFIQDNSPQISSNNQYRLRGMAISEEEQGRGFGKLIFAKGLQILQEKRVRYLWFNAREHAVEFYKKQDCFIDGRRFVIPGVGPHYFMFRAL